MTIVREFHLRFGGDAPAAPPLQPDPAVVRLRARLIREEFNEVMVELATLAHTTDPYAVVTLYRRLLKELADLRYATDGAAVSLGLPIDEAFAAVHVSNMTKSFQTDAGGKVQKGPGYVPPNMALLVPDIVTMEEADTCTSQAV